MEPIVVGSIDIAGLPLCSEETICSETLICGTSDATSGIDPIEVGTEDLTPI